MASIETSKRLPPGSRQMSRTTANGSRFRARHQRKSNYPNRMEFNSSRSSVEDDTERATEKDCKRSGGWGGLKRLNRKRKRHPSLWPLTRFPPPSAALSVSLAIRWTISRILQHPSRRQLLPPCPSSSLCPFADRNRIDAVRKYAAFVSAQLRADIVIDGSRASHSSPTGER